jgi:hypothetical protein
MGNFPKTMSPIAVVMPVFRERSVDGCNANHVSETNYLKAFVFDLVLAPLYHLPFAPAAIVVGSRLGMFRSEYTLSQSVKPDPFDEWGRILDVLSATFAALVGNVPRAFPAQDCETRSSHSARLAAIHWGNSASAGKTSSKSL